MDYTVKQIADFLHLNYTTVNAVLRENPGLGELRNFKSNSRAGVSRANFIPGKNLEAVLKKLKFISEDIVDFEETDYGVEVLKASQPVDVAERISGKYDGNFSLEEWVSIIYAEEHSDASVQTWWNRINTIPFGGNSEGPLEGLYLKGRWHIRKEDFERYTAASGKYYTRKKLAEIAGISDVTLDKYRKTGVITATMLPTGKRGYDEKAKEDLMKVLHKKVENKTNKIKLRAAKKEKLKTQREARRQKVKEDRVKEKEERLKLKREAKKATPKVRKLNLERVKVEEKAPSLGEIATKPLKNSEYDEQTLPQNIPKIKPFEKSKPKARKPRKSKVEKIVEDTSEEIVDPNNYISKAMEAIENGEYGSDSVLFLREEIEKKINNPDSAIFAVAHQLGMYVGDIEKNYLARLEVLSERGLGEISTYLKFLERQMFPEKFHKN